MIDGDSQSKSGSRSRKNELVSCEQQYVEVPTMKALGKW